MSLDVYVVRLGTPVTGYPKTQEERDSLVSNQVDSFNETHNVAPMARAAGLGFLWDKESDGMTTKEALPLLQKGLEYMDSNREELEKLNPKNGWGSYNTLKDFISKLIVSCTSHPDAFLEFWR